MKNGPFLKCSFNQKISTKGKEVKKSVGWMSEHLFE